jgi:hypothetical protein
VLIEESGVSEKECIGSPNRHKQACQHYLSDITRRMLSCKIVALLLCTLLHVFVSHAFSFPCVIADCKSQAMA